VWKIVLVVEILGRPNGVGFKMGLAFQQFDLPLLQAYVAPFVALMIAIESVVLRPAERSASWWRRHAP
jgi:NitT/TauT family transport system permease protein